MSDLRTAYSKTLEGLENILSITKSAGDSPTLGDLETLNDHIIYMIVEIEDFIKKQD